MDSSLNHATSSLAPKHATPSDSSTDELEDAQGLDADSTRIEEGDVHDTASGPIKKKKKKRKTPAQKKAAQAKKLEEEERKNVQPEPAMSVLKISRNKHMKYISSYHGPWLQLPHEVLDSLLSVNCDPEALPTVRGLLESRPSTYSSISEPRRSRFLPISSTTSSSDSRTNAKLRDHEESLPPPIDTAVFRGVSEIRKLVDDASDLAVRAASGLSAAALGALNISNGMGSSLGGDNNSGMGHQAGGLGGGNGPGGRNAAMSPLRQHKLRSLAVSKLAEAYKIDEIAASVVVMQGSTGLDDLAMKVLKYEPDSLDARYVHFFHEKIPSRTLALSTNTSVLDQLLLENPHRLEYYRTRGIVHTFKQDYPSAISNFTQALTQAKAARKAKQFHFGDSGPKSRKKGKAGGGRSNGNGKEKSTDLSGPDSAPSASVPAREEAEAIGKEPGDDLERQILFHRGMAQFHYACKLIEDTVLSIEEIAIPLGGLSNEGGELTLRNLGILLKDESAGLYGCASEVKKEQYRTQLGENPELQESITTSLRKSIKDLERYLSYFSIWEAPAGSNLEEEGNRFHRHPSGNRASDRPLIFRGRRLIHHRSLSGRSHPSDPRRRRNGERPSEAALLTTYHPLLIEAHFEVLIALLLLGDWEDLVVRHEKVVRLMDYLEGYPIFLPARSLNQSGYAELLERLSTVYLASPLVDSLPTSSSADHTTSPSPSPSRSRSPSPSSAASSPSPPPANSDLQSLVHLLNFFSLPFIETLLEQSEKQRKEYNNSNFSHPDFEDEYTTGRGKETAGSGGTGGKSFVKGVRSIEAPQLPLQKKENLTAKEREKIESDRRKIDPTYATYNTARAEVALAYLVSVVIPRKEAEELESRETQAQELRSSAGGSHGHGKGKGKAIPLSNGNGASGSGSGSWTSKVVLEEPELEEEY